MTLMSIFANQSSSATAGTGSSRISKSSSDAASARKRRQTSRRKVLAKVKHVAPELEGELMTYMSDAVWSQVIETEHRLPAETRIEFEEAVRSYLEGERIKINCVSGATRVALRRAKSARVRLLDELTLLEGSPDYRRYNSTESAEATSLSAYQAALGDMDARLHADEQRLSKRAPRNWQLKEWRWKLGPLFVELLDIRSFYLKIDVPTQAAETVNSGRFIKFLEVFLQLVEPNSSGDEFKKMLNGGIDFAVEANQSRRAKVIYSWQWDELFPQTHLSLMMSRRFLDG
jgi:hypothetical protein